MLVPISTSPAKSFAVWKELSGFKSVRFPASSRIQVFNVVQLPLPLIAKLPVPRCDSGPIGVQLESTGSGYSSLSLIKKNKGYSELDVFSFSVACSRPALVTRLTNSNDTGELGF